MLEKFVSIQTFVQLMKSYAGDMIIYNVIIYNVIIHGKGKQVEKVGDK